MPEILNYTGKSIGICNEEGKPMKVLPATGRAYTKTSLQRVEGSSIIPIYRKIVDKLFGIPRPDNNYQKLFIVNEDVAEYLGSSRFDLLVPQDGFEYEGTTFYKHLIQV